MTQDEKWLLKEKYNGKKSVAFFAECKRLTSGEPLAYVIGHVPFLNTTIRLDSHPLIPRLETEYWVSKVIHEISARGKSSVRILDLCAGSGCIGVSVLKAVPQAHVDFAEIDVRHHPTIFKNISENHIAPERAHIIDGDLFEHVHGTYDYILSNPPYIDESLGRTEESVTLHEPHLALWGGKNGIEIIERVIKHSHAHLASGGLLYLEHEPEQKDAIATLAKFYGFKTVTSYFDQYGTIRYTRLSIDTTGLSVSQYLYER